MDSLKNLCFEYLPQLRYDHLALGVIDFKSQKIESFSLIKNSEQTEEVDKEIYFDLASITKILTLATAFQLHPEYFDDDMKLLLEHRGGLPEWGLLPSNGWREILNGYKIQSAATAYSDYSALRLQLEIEQKAGKSLKDIVSPIWDNRVKFWKDLTGEYSPDSGFRSGKKIKGVVHDPNAYTINGFCSHAGLFSTVEGLCQTYINLNEKTDFLSRVGSRALKNPENRFAYGFDTASKDGKSLAGAGCSDQTFGHLGFTGTCIWFDAQNMLGWALLSNATKWFWYDKSLLNDLRRKIGCMVWQNR